jgi:hypothetical protein
MKVIGVILTAFVVIASIPLTYRLLEMLITGNHPDNAAFYFILITTPLLPVVMFMVVREQYQKK